MGLDTELAGNTTFHVKTTFTVLSARRIGQATPLAMSGTRSSVTPGTDNKLAAAALSLSEWWEHSAVLDMYFTLFVQAPFCSHARTIAPETSNAPSDIGTGG